MFVCICNPTTDKQIVECASDGCTLSQLKQNLKICNQCKLCAKEIKDIYNKVKK